LGSKIKKVNFWAGFVSASTALDYMYFFCSLCTLSEHVMEGNKLASKAWSCGSGTVIGEGGSTEALGGTCFISFS
jgi:hypothetical protein